MKQVALRLRRVLRQSDTAGRLGGDEFALVLPFTDEAGAVKVAEKLIKVLEPAFKIGDNTLKCGCSIGIAVYPEHGEDVTALCKSADAAVVGSAIVSVIARNKGPRLIKELGSFVSGIKRGI